jgi:type VI secretion system secreted protein Hcp
MAFDAFLKIEGIPGESSDDKHKEWIEVLSFGWMVHQPKSVASTSGSRSAERANFEDFNITKLIDKASPKLAIACASGEHFKTAVLEVCRAGGDKIKYMEYKLSDIMITIFQPSGHTSEKDALPMESVNFTYGKVELKYTQTDPATGKAKGDVAAGWDLNANKKI